VRRWAEATRRILRSRDGTKHVAAGVGVAADLLHAALHGFGPLSDSLELLTKAKLLLGALGGDDDTPTIIAGELLAARDDVSALLLSAVMLEEVGVAALVTRDVVYRGGGAVLPAVAEHGAGLEPPGHDGIGGLVGALLGGARAPMLASPTSSMSTAWSAATVSMRLLAAFARAAGRSPRAAWASCSTMPSTNDIT
jgi:hypothetical protein